MCDSTKHGANGYIIDKMKENNDNNKENVILLEDHYNLIFILYLMESESSKNVGPSRVNVKAVIFTSSHRLQ